MRLDEWQKYIDSQFLDDTPVPSAPASLAAEPGGAPSAPKEAIQSLLPLEVPRADADSGLPDTAAIPKANDFAAPSAALAFSTADSQVNQQADEAEPQNVPPLVADTPAASVSARQIDENFPEPALSITHSVFTLVVAPPAPAPAPSGRTPRIEVLTPLPDAPADSLPREAEVVNKTRRRSQTRAAQQEDAADPATTLSPSAPPMSPEALSELFLPVSDLGADIPEFARYLPSSHAAASIAEAQPPVAAATTPAAHTGSLPSADVPTKPRSTSEPMRRAPRSRARHTRSMPPANAPSSQSAAEAWANVPRLMQTLLSLERIEEENEVAQFSYKRPFQEKRHELIERLFDPILSLEDTARLLNVCPTTVRRYTNKGILTYYRKEVQRGGKNGEAEASSEKETRQRRFRLSDILAFLESQQSALSADRNAERRQRARAIQSPAADLRGSHEDAGEAMSEYSHAEMRTKAAAKTSTAGAAKDV